jgi:KUP system potassium uptake protein
MIILQQTYGTRYRAVPKDIEEKLEPRSTDQSRPISLGKLAKIVVLAMGVVYGDLGSNVLFTLKTAFSPRYGLKPDHATILGLLSLIIWALIIVVSLKYVTYVMNADNRGEGGVIALLAQVQPPGRIKTRGRWLLVMIGLFGATVLYGDCTVTGAISVLSAVEGLEVAGKGMGGLVIPITVIILFLLYLFQRQGSRIVGAAFGPMMVIWFATIAALGIPAIVQQPQVLKAINPSYGLTYLGQHGWHGFLTLGIVFLAVTGGEALFSDIGHFGKAPIRIGWLTVVLPALFCNYFGQGAFLMVNPNGAYNPFYLMAPSWALYPLLVLATLATVIASQAVISGAFAITRQAVQLGFFPRMKIEHTSAEHVGQVYIRTINWILGGCTIALVLAFQKSTNLANAYGVPVSTTMIVTTILTTVIVFEKWKWPKWVAVTLAAFFLIPDAVFFSSNLIKIGEGGWFPMLVGILAFTLTSTWRRGSMLVKDKLKENLPTTDEFLEKYRHNPIPRIKGTAVYLTESLDRVPRAFFAQLEHYDVLHEKVIFLTLLTESIPQVPADAVIEKRDLGQGFYRVISRYGFMDKRDMADIFNLLNARKLMDLDIRSTSFILGRTYVKPEGLQMNSLRSAIFAFVLRNSVPVTEFIKIPTDRVVELGGFIEI